MKQKINNNTFHFELPNIPDVAVSDMMNEWAQKVISINSNEDVWTVIPELPRYKFKNLKVELSPFELNDDVNNLTLTFKYDTFVDNI